MKMTINGKVVAVGSNWEKESLIDFLREELDLTGAKNGCRVGACGACTVIIDGKAKLACKTQVKDVDGGVVTTIEGLSKGPGELHPLQQSFIDHGAIQCGFCTPGMVLRAHAFLMKRPRPTRDEIRKAISPNLCRCTGYQQIIDAVEAAASGYAADQEQPTRGES